VAEKEVTYSVAPAATCVELDPVDKTVLGGKIRASLVATCVEPVETGDSLATCVEPVEEENSSLVTSNVEPVERH